LIFGHFALAAVGLIVWILYVATDTKALAWTAFGLLVVIALLGFTMLIRWLPTYRGRSAVAKLPDAITGSGPAEGLFRSRLSLGTACSRSPPWCSCCWQRPA
jgi:hypothetical protein